MSSAEGDGARPEALRRVTIVDVASHAGVSIASASKVVRRAYGVSASMRDRVHASIAELGYRPHRLAQGLRGSTKTIGVLLPDIENPFFDLLIRGASRIFAGSGHDLFVAIAGTTTDAHQRATESLMDHRMDGLILVSPRGSSDQLERYGSETPVVVVGRHGPADGYDTVSGDDGHGARLVADHLRSLGHSSIAFLANDSDADESLPENVRRDSFIEALLRSGAPAPRVIRTPWTSDGGRAAADELLADGERPTAVFAGADIVALGLLTEFWDRGIEVPHQISVVGYDDSPTARLRPVSLTSVDQSGVRMGALAAELLLSRIEGRREARHELLEPELRVRATSATRSADT